MTCKTWWIIASIDFLVGMIMLALGYILLKSVVGLYLLLGACGVIAAGWVLWIVGFVSYLRWR